LALVAGCASAPKNDPEALAEFQKLNDPAEPLNRDIFNFNKGLDDAAIKPVTAAYRAVAPETVRRGVHNFLNNLRTPVILANDLLQGELRRAGITLTRFAINSTIGVLGFSDQASGMGFDFHNEDFGQTLAVWGVSEGPYLMLPILGPSNPRDAVGFVIDFFFDPINYWANNTNDLDVDTLRALEDALLDFPGCAVVISHDRWFLDRIATHVLAFEGDSQVVWFEGNYADYEQDRRRRLGAAADQPHRIKYRPLTRD